MLSPSARAACSGRNTNTPTPSAGTNPSAASSKARVAPVGDVMPSSPVSLWNAGVEVMNTPPASAISLSPEARLLHAKCRATSEDEHAVSMASAGPFRLSR